MARKVLPPQLLKDLWLLGFGFHSLVGCAPKEVFYFSGPMARSTPQSVLAKVDSVAAPHVFKTAEPVASLAASAGEVPPAILPMAYALDSLSHSTKIQAYKKATPVVKKWRAPRQAQETDGGKKPRKGTAQTGLLLGLASLVLAVAGLSTLTRSGVALLPLALLISLGGALLSGQPLSWNRKHPDDPVPAKGAKTGLTLSLVSIGLLTFFGTLFLVLF